MTDKEGFLKIIDYSEKSFVLVGDTIIHADAISKLGGTYNPRLRTGPGWIFSKLRQESVQKYIDTGKIEPYVHPKKEQKKEPAKKVDLKVLFTEIREAFDPESDYEGQSIMDVINTFEEKYIGKPKAKAKPVLKKSKDDESGSDSEF